MGFVPERSCFLELKCLTLQTYSYSKMVQNKTMVLFVALQGAGDMSERDRTLAAQHAGQIMYGAVGNSSLSRYRQSPFLLHLELFPLRTK